MINFKNFFQKYLLFFILGSVIIFIFVLKFLVLKSEKAIPQETNPTPLPSTSSTSQPSVTITSSPIPAGKSDPLILKKLIEESQQKFPLANFLPYENQDFKIDYVGALKLKVIFKNPQASASAVYNWIKSKNIDPNTHIFEFSQ